MARVDHGENGRPPKPYEFVPIPSASMRPERPVGHHQYVGDLMTGSITGMITAHSPVHVSSGQIELTESRPSLARSHFRREGRLTIPGSSLKGAIRSIVESISNPPSCLRITRARVQEQPQNVRGCSRKDRLCIACRMFGAMGYLGQVQLRDAVLIQGTPIIIQTPSLFAPRSRARLYVERGRVKGRKFYRHGELARGNVPLEACAPGSQFELEVDFENLSDAQLGLLLVAFGLGTPSFYPKLGGSKPSCCGSVAFHVTAIQIISAQEAALDFDLVTRQVDMTSAVAVTRLVSTDALQEISHILHYPGDGPCPEGTY